MSAAKPGAAEDYVLELRAGRFEAAEAAAAQALDEDGGNAVAAAVRALARYRNAGVQLVKDFEAVVEGADGIGRFDHERMRAAYARTEKALAEVEGDLAIAAAAADFELALCLACWEQDWNHNGRIDDGDRLLFQIELDSQGRDIPEGDPRRKPTFRFDQGDLYWGRAMIAFQRAGLDLILAYRWTELDKLLSGDGERKLPKITIRLDDAERVRSARALILQGLDHADRARELFLAETDDDREWVPNPRQKSHPLPLPVDATLYATWEGVLGDVRRLVSGDEGISVAEVVRLLDDDWPSPPPGYIDIGQMLAEPRDFVLDFEVIIRTDHAAPGGLELVLRSVLGDRYVASMKPSPLVGRLARMKSEIERGEDDLGRKLRYLLWLN